MPPPVPENGADSIHSYENLPEIHWKKYIYAARFVSLVRAKTPKVTLYTELAKCTLMENSPDPDFEAVFYSGWDFGILKECKLNVYMLFYYYDLLIRWEGNKNF